MIKIIQMKFCAPLVAVLALAACETPVPDSGAGVGFDDYSEYRNEREAELAGRGPLVAGGQVSGETIAGQPQTPESVQQTTPARANNNNPGISDEQDFSAVSSRESIASDAERRTVAQGAFQIIKPTALPTRSGGSGASVVNFALSTSNRVGQAIYQRSALSGESRFQRNCARFQSADRAQETFLKAGGPQRDPRGIDPDGDGFACFWDPSPYRRAVGN